MGRAIMVKKNESTFEEQMDSAMESTIAKIEDFTEKFYKKYDKVPHYLPILYCMAFDMFHGFEMDKEEILGVFGEMIDDAINAYEDEE